MGAINIDDLRPGMVLAQDVLGKNGRLLLPAGTALLPNHMRVLRIWGVTEAAVVGEEAPGQAPDGAAMEAAREAAEAQFRCANLEHEAVAELFRLRAQELVVATSCPASPRQADFLSEPDLLPPLAGPQALVSDDPSLASFPDIYYRLREALDDPASSAGHIAGIIGRDPALAASLLRLANSPFYGFPKRIDSLARGVMIIGAGELAQLALGISVVARFLDIPSGCITMRQAWEHAVGCGVLARVLAAHRGGLPPERLFVAGLLHDLGRLVLLRRLPRHVARVMTLARERGVPLYAAERDVLGFDHAEVGQALLAHWRLPPALCDTVRDHHAQGAMDLEAALVHVADVAAIAQGFGYNGSPLVPPLNPAAWEALGLPVSVLAVALSQARRQVGDIVSMLLG